MGSEAAGSCPGRGAASTAQAVALLRHAEGSQPGQALGVGLGGPRWGVLALKLFRGPGSHLWLNILETSPCDGQVTSGVRTRPGGLSWATSEEASFVHPHPPPDRVRGSLGEAGGWAPRTGGGLWRGVVSGHEKHQSCAEAATGRVSSRPPNAPARPLP